ncbi:hypothetical protein [Streptomyces sp. NPDC059072]|uniref:hypothetical protein n=1 Tax=Streptomyces sp. NPDC059072 TaxID=3346715 RepID=UPI0036CC3324
MLVELMKVVTSPGSPRSPWPAQVRTPFGETMVGWCGDTASEPGEYHVEWTVDEDIVWGRNAKPAVGVGPGVRPVGHRVVLRGRLNLTVDGAGVFDLDGTQILLDLAGPVPEGVGGTWVEIFIEREKIALYPYEL